MTAGRSRRWAFFLIALGVLLAALPALGTEPAAAGSAAPAASASASARAELKVRDNVVFELKAPLGGKSAAERARTASQALSRAVEEDASAEVRVDKHGDVAVIFVGSAPVIELGEGDAVAAGSASLDVYAASSAAKLKDALRAEARRSQVAKTVFSVSLTVFFGLIALYLLRKVGEFEDRARVWIAEHPDSIPRISLQSIEVVRPPVLRSTILIALGIGRWAAQISVGWTWLLVTLSLFDATRGTSERLSGLVVAPLSALMGRIATALPLLLVVAIGALSVVMLLRFLSLFFASVARGETPLTWLPADLAAPTSIALRAAVVIVALVVAAPVVTGDPDGALTRGGAIALYALGLASTPLLASVVVGAVTLFGRRLHVGDWVEIGGRAGRVTALTLTDVELTDADRCSVRVPHLMSLWHPTRIVGVQRRLETEITVPLAEATDDLRVRLRAAAARAGNGPKVEIAAIEGALARLRVSASSDAPEALGTLTSGVLEALTRTGSTRPPPDRGEE